MGVALSTVGVALIWNSRWALPGEGTDGRHYGHAAS